jgi:hypothetical protein
MSKLYRCGWCGSPTDERGHCLTPEQANAMTGDWDAAEQTNGDCCPNGDGQAEADARRDALRRYEWEQEMRTDAFGERC